MSFDVGLLRKIQEVILKEPQEFDMEFFMDVVPRCGTVACIAGHAWCVANSMSLKQAIKRSPSQVAVRLGAAAALNVTDVQMKHLFYLGYWPHSFANAYFNAKTCVERANIAVERIDYFIETKGDYTLNET